MPTFSHDTILLFFVILLMKRFSFLGKNLFPFCLMVAILVIAIGCTNTQLPSTSLKTHIQKQLAFGPRIPGSEASLKTAIYFKDYLEDQGWMVDFQEFKFNGVKLRNVIARNSVNPPDLIIGAHYDTRQFSDQDPIKSKQIEPVPGAVDGGSGSALLLGLGNQVKDNKKNIWLVFFDGEDQGRINYWQWSIGAEFFTKSLLEKPKNVVILDMLGDGDLKVYKELNSDPKLSTEIWNTAETLGYSSSFVNEQKHSLIDDHLPFINLGIPTALLIDFDYPYWHTTSDTLNKVSEQNLELVMEVMLSWIGSN